MKKPSRREMLGAAGSLLIANALPGAALARATRHRGAASPVSIMDSLASQYLAEAKAVSVGIFLPGQEIFRSYVLGRPSTEYNDLTVYGIGSNTKVFTATLLASQCSGSNPSRSLNDSAAQYLPAKVKQHGTTIKTVTLRDLATHTSSFPDSVSAENHNGLFSGTPPSANQINWWTDWTNAQNAHDPCSTHAPGTCWNYSNWGFITLGFAVANSNAMPGSTYPELLSKVITGPLGLRHTGANVSVSVPGYDKNGSTPALPADLKSNARDLLTFLEANLGEGHNVPASLQTAMNFARQMHWDGSKYQKPQDTMGLAWQLPPPRSGKPQIVWKNGEAGGYTSFMGMIPSKKIAIAILTNSANATPTRAGMKFLREIEG